MDDSYNFRADGTFGIDRGTEKCESAEVKLETGSYSRAAKNVTIKGVTYTLAEASESQVKYYIAIASNTGYDHAVILLQPQI